MEVDFSAGYFCVTLAGLVLPHSKTVYWSRTPLHTEHSHNLQGTINIVYGNTSNHVSHDKYTLR